MQLPDDFIVAPESFDSKRTFGRDFRISCSDLVRSNHSAPETERGIVWNAAPVSALKELRPKAHAGVDPGTMAEDEKNLQPNHEVMTDRVGAHHSK
jgi:hypothetical protein